MMLRTQCERLRLPDRSDLESRPRCTSWLTSHTLRTWIFPSVASDGSLTILNLSASSKEDILKSGTTVASLFFKNVFGSQAQKALTAFVALRYVLRVLLYALDFEAKCGTVH